MASYDVAIIGSGVIGLTNAWRLAEVGLRVCVVDPQPGRGASYVAAGLLAPVTEACWGEEALLEINLRSSTMWPGFAAELESKSGYSVDFQQCGTLLVGLDRSDRTQLEELLDFHRHLGLSSAWYQPTACRELEPLLSPGVTGGIFAPDDHQVDNRKLLVALMHAARRSGVTMCTKRVDSIATTGMKADGVVVGDELIRAETVILAAGSSSANISGLAIGSLPPIRPVKGQILRLRMEHAGPFLRHCVRAQLQDRPVYVASRIDGRVVVGATMEERDNEMTVTTGGVYELLRSAIRVLPGISELEFCEMKTGLRPGSPDNAPVVGPSAITNLVFATGHFRNGILLAPVTAEAIVELVQQGSLPNWAEPFSPVRFQRDTSNHLESDAASELQPIA